jgi:DNA-binding CsgD family transcriptional regulator
MFSHFFVVARAKLGSPMAHIYRKLNVQNAPVAVTKAFQMGILPTTKGS